ncbi:dihydrolipoyl dehydrogenase [Halobellus limi]|uniref:Dihydrolipoyl dehydrogenase n=1 Tax=Halobellus limi TaxID=699433 RepID=A0A1H6BFP6_9EURY|nr:dihydrolipoyl dehydrogenase [Halobellus limi]QCC49021.1 dihydrolipoyl dehydrogenase [Halobellus limi]SEG59598.1 dihydrolipoamide dehydrogenase [Halobellus limi]
MSEFDTEVLVVGGGPAGYVAAIRAAQYDLDVTLVEENTLGGTCLNRGCIPSKALISAANVAHDARNWSQMGITADVDVDFGRMVEWKDDVVENMNRSVEKLCKANRVSLLEGRAAFEDEHSVQIDGPNGESERLTFEHAVLATGSRPIELPGFEFDRPGVLDAKEALALEERPDSLVVVGAGYIGMELSMLFAKLGVDVTVVEALDTMMPAFPSDLVAPVSSAASELGIETNYGELASACQSTEGGVTVATEDVDSEERREYDADKVLVAVGRSPVTDTVALDRIGLEPDGDGFVPTDEHGRTDLDHVFAVGDVAGEPMLAHAGSAEGEIAAAAIAGRGPSAEDRAIPAVAFTSPEIATVGLSREEAEATDHDVSVGEFPMRASGRALTTGHTDGFVRLVSGDDGVVLGGQIVGPEASELISEVTLAVEEGLTTAELAESIHPHPTLSEAISEAAANEHDLAIHTLNR